MGWGIKNSYIFNLKYNYLELTYTQVIWSTSEMVTDFFFPIEKQSIFSLLQSGVDVCLFWPIDSSVNDAVLVPGPVLRRLAAFTFTLLEAKNDAVEKTTKWG